MAELRTHTVARAAYARVCARANESLRTKYGALVHKLPGMILQNGLAQSTGFLLAKGNDEHHAVLDDLRAVLHETRATSAADRNALHEEIIKADLTRTLLLTRRALEASGWMKRYVQGALGIDATGEIAADPTA